MAQMEMMAGDINSTRLATGSKVREGEGGRGERGRESKIKKEREKEGEREGVYVCGNTLIGTAAAAADVVAPFLHFHLFLPSQPSHPFLLFLTLL